MATRSRLTVQDILEAVLEDKNMMEYSDGEMVK